MFNRLKSLNSIHLISFFLGLLSFSYFNYAALNWVVIHSLSNVITLFDDGRRYELFKFHPFYPFIVLLGILTGFLFAYLALKSNSRSRKYWWITLLSIIFVPIIFTFLVRNVLGKSYFTMLNMNSTSNSSVTPVPFNINQVTNLIIANFIPIVLIICLLINYKKFNQKNKELSSRPRNLLVITFTILIMTFTGYLIHGYTQSQDTDLGYSKAQSQTSFHIYRPDYLTGRISQVSAVQTNAEQGAYKDTVKTIYNTSFFNRDKNELNKNEGIVIISQVKESPNFDVSNYVKNRITKPGIQQAKEVPLNISVNKMGYLVITKNINNVVTLYFQTNDFVFFQLTTLHLPEEESIKIAESLK